MKLKCIKTSLNQRTHSKGPDTYEYINLKNYITLNKIYKTTNQEPASEWVYNITDDNGNTHDISKECFITLREQNLENLLK